MPELWKVKSETFKNKAKKKVAYEKLVQKLKEIYPTASKTDVIAKLNSFKSSYRRELRKIRDSKKSGVGTDEMYVSNLWCFEDLSFLTDQETPVMGTSSLDNVVSIQLFIIVYKCKYSKTHIL